MSPNPTSKQVTRRLGVGALALAATVATTATSAHADKKKRPPTVAEQVEARLYDLLTTIEYTAPTRFVFHLANDFLVDPKPGTELDEHEVGFWVIKGKATAAVAADGQAVIYAADLGWAEPCGDETCPKVPRPDGIYRVTAVLDGKAPWTALAWHLGRPITGKDQKAAIAAGERPRPLPRRIGKGAEAAVAVFEASIGDPRALARTVSARTDVVLYGSGASERYVGGAKVAATLGKWNLTFKVRDGLQAGVTRSGTVAWVAANLDATSAKKPGAATPYRAMFVYERHVDQWQLVQAHFSFPSD